MGYPAQSIGWSQNLKIKNRGGSENHKKKRTAHFCIAFHFHSPSPCNSCLATQQKWTEKEGNGRTPDGNYSRKDSETYYPGGGRLLFQKSNLPWGGDQQTHASQAGKGNGGVWADSIPGRNAGDGTSMGQTGGLTIKRAVFCSFFTRKTKKIPVV